MPRCDNLDVSSPAVSAAPAWRSGSSAPARRRPTSCSPTHRTGAIHPKAQQAGTRATSSTRSATWPRSSSTSAPATSSTATSASRRRHQPRRAVRPRPLRRPLRGRGAARPRSLDPLAAMATTDEAKLRELLAEVSRRLRGARGDARGARAGRATDGLTDPDDVPEPPDEAVTKPGDLWLLGDHRLLCGDAGSEADLDRLLDGVTVDLLLTDPPYNVKVEPRSNNAIAAGMAASYDAVYQDALARLERRAASRRSTPRASTTAGFDVARGKSGIRHHQKLDLERHPEKAQATHRKLRAKDRPLVNDFVSDADVRGAASRPGSGTPPGHAPGRLASTSGAATPTSPTTHPPCAARGSTSARRSSGTRSTRSSRARTSWAPTSGLLRLEGGRRPPLLRAAQRARPVARQEGQPERDGPPHREAGRAGAAGDRVQLAPGRGRARPLRGQSARRSSPASRPGDGRTSWRSTRSTATSWSSAGDVHRAGGRPRWLRTRRGHGGERDWRRERRTSSGERGAGAPGRGDRAPGWSTTARPQAGYPVLAGTRTVVIPCPWRWRDGTGVRAGSSPTTRATATAGTTSMSARSAGASGVDARERRVRPRLPPWPHRRRDVGPIPRVADFAPAPRIIDAPEPLVWTRRDGAFHAATWPLSSPGAAQGAEVVSGPTRRPSMALRASVSPAPVCPERSGSNAYAAPATPLAPGVRAVSRGRAAEPRTMRVEREECLGW